MQGDSYIWVERVKEPTINASILHSHGNEACSRFVCVCAPTFIM